MAELKIVPFWGCMIPIRYPQMEVAARLTMKRLGVDLVDVEGFSCCPDPIYFKAHNIFDWVVLAARNLTVAEQKGLNIITFCSGCTSTLVEVNTMLKLDLDLRERVNKILKKVGREYKGEVEVMHFAVYLRDVVGYEKLKETVVKPLTDLRVGIHYGCHLLKPRQVMDIDDPEYPEILENITKACGAMPVPQDERFLCCGKGCMDTMAPLHMVYDIFDALERAQADCMGLICPTCFSSFDGGQIAIKKKLDRDFQMPVIYLAQLIGLAQGFSAEELFLTRNRIPVDPVLKKLVAQ